VAHKKGANDGLSIRGFGRLDLSKPSMRPFSPPNSWQAKDATILHIEAGLDVLKKIEDCSFRLW
jgi:hypothetical protein